MRFVAVLLLFLMPTWGAYADRRIWRVRSGDALSVLAERFDVTVDQLREWNDLEGDTIQIGQELVVAPAPRRRREAGPGPRYRIAPGDTLSHIANRQGTTVEALLRLNPGLRPDRIRTGQEIRVAEPDGRNRIEYVIRRGDNLSRIAERHRVELRDILRWNRRLRRDRIRAGQRLVLWTAIPESVSESIGAPNRGRLERGERLPSHPGYWIRNRDRAFGTLETTLWIQDAFDALRARHPGAPKVRVHDISLRRGGPMTGHRSHQSGRDVDLSYFQRRCGGQPCPMRRLQPEQLDAERQWTLFEHWLKNDRVDAIFMDYSLQRPLFEAARRAGYSRAQLSRWIQYPRGPGFPLGIVRHFRSHRDHAHVRFTCPETDESCRR
ncbi:MAG: penicillin-insensitive murein endopeptidase [Myxococcota bacterium]